MKNINNIMEECELRFKLIQLILDYDLDGPYIGGFRSDDMIIAKAKKLEDYIITGNINNKTKEILDSLNNYNND